MNQRAPLLGPSEPPSPGPALRYVHFPATEPILARVAHDEARERDGALLPGSGAFFAHAATPGSCRGIAVAFHGFSASCYQWWEVAAHLTQHGLLFYAPRLPGHGHATSARVPRYREWSRYQTFSRELWQDLTPLRRAYPLLPIIVMALSGGSVCLYHWLADHDRALAAAILVSPYVRLRRRAAEIGLQLCVGAAPKRIAHLDRLSIPVGWGADHEQQAAAWRRPGFSRFLLAHVLALHKAKQEALAALLADPARRRVPIQMFVTPSDMLIEPAAAVSLFARLGGASRNLHVMHTTDPTPHAMLTSMENPNAAARAYIHAAMASFLEDVLTSHLSRGR